MSKFYQAFGGHCYTKRWVNGKVITQQIADDGVEWLFSQGVSIGDELGAAYWDLHDQDWLSTGGSGVDFAEVDDSTPFVSNPALTPFDIASEVDAEEPLTVRAHEASPNAPLFLFSSATSIYYTILSIENSSDHCLQVPLLIKYRGAMDLIRMGARVGDEFTESGLRLIFERRWGYFDDERMPN